MLFTYNVIHLFFPPSKSYRSYSGLECVPYWFRLGQMVVTRPPVDWMVLIVVVQLMMVTPECL